MRILVIGGGMAGLVSAAALAEGGAQVCVLEREPELRTEGYMIDFFGPGYDAAERLGLLEALETIHYPVETLRFVDAKGHTRGEVEYARAREVMMKGRHFNFMRGDLERVLFDRLPSGVEVRFGVSPERIDIDGDTALVETSAGDRARWDLVVGADGVHSTTRRIVFDRADVHERSLGCHTAAYILPGTPPSAQPGAFVSLSETDISAAAYPIRGDRTATFFVYRTPDPITDRSRSACRRELEAAFRGQGSLADDLLDAFPREGSVYFDTVTQIELPRWSRGPVVLVGDACGAVSLLAGQGASMAIAGAFVLAQELGRAQGDRDGALVRYESRIRPAVESRQKSGRRNAGWFLPKSHFRAVVRDHVTDLVVRSPLARMFGSALGAGGIPLD